MTTSLSRLTTYAELSADQRARFGLAVQLQDEVRANHAAKRAFERQGADALAQAQGDTVAAFNLMMRGL